MKEASNNNNAKFVVVLFPVTYQVQSTHLNNIPQQKFEKLMQELQIEHLDLLLPLRENYALSGNNLFYDQCHYNVEGNVFVSQVLTDYFESKIETRSDN